MAERRWQAVICIWCFTRRSFSSSRKNRMGVVLRGTSRMTVARNSTVLRAAIVDDHAEPTQRFKQDCRKRAARADEGNKGMKGRFPLDALYPPHDGSVVLRSLNCYPCSEDVESDFNKAVNKWANMDAVQHALNVRQGKIGKWELINNTLHYHQGKNDTFCYSYDIFSSFSYHKQLTSKKCRALILR
ncbi:peptidase S10, serine carboxypeptidase, Alpha/Beta hydrolase fold protein [Artemisia annua]|uniref:Peptidase S10, serine carboxypeptidase, Alpha/Beta hydrolase fold protein n=1 Tax=Artemisia annua TaxID=35608 RepID=A0A2U1LQP4_ARTAN|nr:peptidase S10, serine carboxypeptidase, Alpha/Beta hydrolase fold protein [Artemisia annua]